MASIILIIKCRLFFMLSMLCLWGVAELLVQSVDIMLHLHLKSFILKIVVCAMSCFVLW